MPGDDFNPRIPKLKRCSFCGKTSEQVRRMVAGPNVQICSECILLCQEIISDDFNAEAFPSAAPRSRAPVKSRRCWTSTSSARRTPSAP